MGFPGGSDSKKSACNAEDPGLIPGSRRSPGKGGKRHTPWTEEPGGLHGVAESDMIEQLTHTFTEKV